MARIRTVKPEIVQSVRLAECSRDARLLFVYLITQADCYGNQRGDARLLRGQLFPYDDDITAEIVDGWLEELVARGLVALYEVAGQRYLSLPSWAEHQVVSKPGRPLVPGPGEGAPCMPANPQGTPGPPGGTLADLDLDLDQEREPASTADNDEPRAEVVDLTDARPEVERVSTAEFDEWWELYPKKVDRKAAAKKYQTVRRSGVTREALLDGLRRSVEHWRRERTDRQYIPGPERWLNAGKWDDHFDIDLEPLFGFDRKSGAELDEEMREYARQQVEAAFGEGSR